MHMNRSIKIFLKYLDFWDISLTRNPCPKLGSYARFVHNLKKKKSFSGTLLFLVICPNWLCIWDKTLSNLILHVTMKRWAEINRRTDKVETTPPPTNTYHNRPTWFTKLSSKHKTLGLGDFVRTGLCSATKSNRKLQYPHKQAGSTM